MKVANKNVIASLLAITVAIVAGLFLFLRQSNLPDNRERTTSAPTVTAPAAPGTESPAGSATVPTARPAQPETDALAETNHSEYVERRVSELDDLSLESDPASLAVIVSELTNRDPDIRAAALEAAIQFGSRDAIPGLMDAVGQVDDPEEKARISQAIAFLRLPSISEALPPAKRPASRH